MAKIRKIIKIDEEKCTGCGLCVTACAEGAIQIIDGKARLISESYCDGLGACIGECPEGALTIEEREAEDFDEEAVNTQCLMEKALPSACPGSMTMKIRRQPAKEDHAASNLASSQLTNWPVQLMLISPTAQYFQGADLLLVADCVPFALADFHSRFLKGKPVIVGCPKLDDAGYYLEKLTEILKRSSVNSLTVVHIEVPCCSGLTYIASRAIELSGKDIPLDDYTITIQGDVMADALSRSTRYGSK